MTGRNARKAVLTVPRHLPEDARIVWREVVTYLESAGVLLRIDGGVIEVYATSLVRLRRLNAALESAELVDDDGKPNPLLKVIEATAATVKNTAHVLGLSPGARKAVPKAAATPKGGRWAGVLK